MSFLHNRQVQIALGVGAVALAAAGIWFLLIKPAQSRSTELDGEIVAMQQQIADRRAELAVPRRPIRLKASDLFRLTKAMPDRGDMPGVMLELNRVAKGSKVALANVQPGAAVTTNGYMVQPVSVVVTGRFANVIDFLRASRRLVTVDDGVLNARGRLLSVDTVDFSEPDDERSYPVVKATIGMNAFAFAGGVPVGTQAGEPTSPSESTDTSTSSGEAVAMGATP